MKSPVVYVGFVAAERILYLPSVGFCLLVGFGFQRCVIRTGRRSSSAGSRIILIATVVVLITSLSVRTIVRNRDWSDEEHLYRSAITINPPKGSESFKLLLSMHRFEIEIVTDIEIGILSTPSSE